MYIRVIELMTRLGYDITSLVTDYNRLILLITKNDLIKDYTDYLIELEENN